MGGAKAVGLAKAAGEAKLDAGWRHRRFAVEAGSAAQRVAAWTDALKVSGRVEIDAQDAATFRGEIHALALNEMMATRVASGDFRFRRDPARIERLARDHAFVNFVESGRIVGRLAGRSVTVEPGGVLVTRQGVTMDLAMQGVTWFGLLVPLGRLCRHLEWRVAMDARVFAPGSVEAVMLGSHMRALMELPDQLSARQVGRVARSSFQFLLAHLGAAAGEAVAEPEREIADETALAIRRFIADRLSDPDLGPEAICHEFSLSRSQLYRIVGDGAGIAAPIRRLRLLCAHRDIASGRFEGRPLAEIAARWGMADARTFRRAFTQEFGYAPSTLRERNASDIGANLPDPADAAAEIERWFGT